MSNVPAFAVSAVMLGVAVVGAYYGTSVIRTYTKPNGVPDCEEYVDSELLPKQCALWKTGQGWTVWEGRAAWTIIADLFADRYPENSYSTMLNQNRAELDRLRNARDQVDKLEQFYERGASVLDALTTKDIQRTHGSRDNLYNIFVGSRALDEKY